MSKHEKNGNSQMQKTATAIPLWHSGCTLTIIYPRSRSSEGYELLCQACDIQPAGFVVQFGNEEVEESARASVSYWPMLSVPFRDYQ